jgi:hypothetical protein
MTHDYKRNGTTTLFAALNMLDGSVIGKCMPRHRHREFLRFLKLINQSTPAGLDLHLVADYGQAMSQAIEDARVRRDQLEVRILRKGEEG